MPNFTKLWEICDRCLEKQGECCFSAPNCPIWTNNIPKYSSLWALNTHSNVNQLSRNCVVLSHHDDETCWPSAGQVGRESCYYCYATYSRCGSTKLKSLRHLSHCAYWSSNQLTIACFYAFITVGLYRILFTIDFFHDLSILIFANDLNLRFELHIVIKMFFGIPYTVSSHSLN